MASGVRKDEVFYMGVFARRDDEMPVLVAAIDAGHPSRGALALATDTELGAWPGAYAQLYRLSGAGGLSDERAGGVQYVALNVSSSTPRPLTARIERDGPVAQVPNTFVAASEARWWARTRGATQTCGVPGARATLC